jgi:tRNA-splicing ligase RtcB (3'-phosphate/5'-hydroxy nucleic acid ligase)
VACGPCRAPRSSSACFAEAHATRSQRGHGVQQDLDRCEDRGVAEDADPGAVSDRALQRGVRQVGSLGSGNHFLEVQVVDEICDPHAAAALDLTPGRVCVMIHCGSRGLGHQICSDHVRTMVAVMPRYGITVPDPAGLRSRDVTGGRAYLGAMAAAANYGRANRQLLTEATRDAFAAATGTASLDLLYDVSHNLAKIEDHMVDGRQRTLCVHRKGATRALPPGHPDLPPDLAAIGQPVLVPGSMGTASYVLVGVPEGRAFFSACHGAGRTMSRHAARRGSVATSSGRSSSRRASPSDPDRRPGSPRRPRSPTRTSTRWFARARRRGWPAESPGSSRSAW